MNMYLFIRVSFDELEKRTIMEDKLKFLFKESEFKKENRQNNLPTSKEFQSMKFPKLET